MQLTVSSMCPYAQGIWSQSAFEAERKQSPVLRSWSTVLAKWKIELEVFQSSYSSQNRCECQCLASLRVTCETAETGQCVCVVFRLEEGLGLRVKFWGQGRFYAPWSRNFGTTTHKILQTASCVIMERLANVMAHLSPVEKTKQVINASQNFLKWFDSMDFFAFIFNYCSIAWTAAIFQTKCKFGSA